MKSLIRPVFSLILILSVFFLAKLLGTDSQNMVLAEPTILTGVVLLSAYMMALLLKKASLPKLTGYMLLGILIGPAGLDFLNHDNLEQLRFLEKLALSFIAITAGGEFKYSKIKENLKTVLMLLSGQVVFVLIGIFGLLVVFSKYIPFMSGLEYNLIIGFSILFAGTALSTSPATTMGIIVELKAKGKLTDLVLSVTVLKSILLVLAFPLLIGWAKIYLIEGTTINKALIGSIAAQIIGSIILGVIVGYIIIFYLKYIGREKSLFLLGIAIVITEISSLFSIEILLTSIIAGIVVENFSSEGAKLINSIEESSLPLYIIFFSFAGAGLHLDTLKAAIGFTVFLVLIRMLLIYLGNLGGAVVSNGDKAVRNLSWMGFIGQAGIAMGLGLVIENAFPGGVGTNFKTILIGSVVINELMGPVFFKYILVKSGEAVKEI